MYEIIKATEYGYRSKVILELSSDISGYAFSIPDLKKITKSYTAVSNGLVVKNLLNNNPFLAYKVSKNEAYSLYVSTADEFLQEILSSDLNIGDYDYLKILDCIKLEIHYIRKEDISRFVALVDRKGSLGVSKVKVFSTNSNNLQCTVDYRSFLVTGSKSINNFIKVNCKI